jgi:hypothetical protein
MRGADGTSRKYNRLRLVTEGFQVSKTIVECHVDEPKNVLTNDETGSDLVNNADHFRPEVTVIVLASSLPGDTKWLAREPAGDEVDARSADISSSVWFAPLDRSPLHGRGVGNSGPVVPHSLLRTLDPFPDMLTSQRSDIPVDGDSWEVLGQHLLAERVDLAELDGGEPGPAGGESEAAQPMPENKST